ncbi:hypothetical protein ACFYWN_04175 [Streptomyces sp. NPDC002917]|uniref:hypothetical protein n=1 Tax=unclassified Streptomyces TaxID=2593676 RepID=UPI002E8026B9|nr:hypothetical protein [Streptomyces sp. NBC_00562]WTD32706.1 hypothetical protein OHB03_11020 [Streptomyces sp. NBC_01643]WUC19217.1 hypothetical protein OHA33_10285 [Streptomyces sp. NBC_00562]
MTTADSPHRADGWTAAVRQRLGLGRLLPLGGPADGAWISERAAVAVLRRSAGTPGPGPVLGEVRIAVADPDSAPDPALPAPPSALPPGPLRIEATMSATADRPLPTAAAALRSALLAAAAQRLGLVVGEVDLRVTELLDTVPERPAPEPSAVRGTEPEGVAGTAAAGVPGVATLTRVLGSAVYTGPDHVRVELATSGDHRALDVALAVRTAVSDAVDGHPPVTVLVTAVVEED